MPDSSPSATTIYGEYLKDELARQDSRQSSFEQRGIAVVTTAGTLVTLLFALAALSTASAKGNPLGHEETVWLAVALVLFFVAAALALFTNFPLKYEGPGLPDPKHPGTPSFADRLNADPEDNHAEAVYAVADVRLTVLSSAQQQNGRKGWFLFAALIFEVGAVACVAVAIFELLAP
jgi:MFS family permease